MPSYSESLSLIQRAINTITNSPTIHIKDKRLLLEKLYIRETEIKEEIKVNNPNNIENN
jgi:hypothetical protein